MRSTDYGQMRDMVGDSKLAHNALDHIERRTATMRQDQINLTSKLLLADEQANDKSGAGLQTELNAYITRELEYVRLFNTSKTDLKLPYQVRTNKMEFILTEVYSQINADTDANSFINLARKNLSLNYDNNFNNFPILRTDTYWGSNRGTIQSAKLLSIRFAFSKESILDYKDSSIAHVTPCEKPSLPIEEYVNSKFFVPLARKSGFGFVHGGYAFGGQRGEEIQYTFGPEDCSSMVANLLEQTINETGYQPATNQFSTIDLLHAWESKKQLYNLKPVKQENLQTGDIFLLRTETSGHTGIVLNRDPDNPSKVLIFECARDMEKGLGNAGAGLGSHEIKPVQGYGDRTTGTMFLRCSA